MEGVYEHLTRTQERHCNLDNLLVVKAFGMQSMTLSSRALLTGKQEHQRTLDEKPRRENQWVCTRKLLGMQSKTMSSKAVWHAIEYLNPKT